VGNQLAQEDLCVRVQRVDHQAQQLFHFGLEAQRLAVGAGGGAVGHGDSPVFGGRSGSSRLREYFRQETTPAAGFPAFCHIDAVARLTARHLRRSAATTLRPSAARMSNVLHAAAVSITSTPTPASVNGRVSRGCGKRIVGPAPNSTTSGFCATSSSKWPSVRPSNPEAAQPVAIASDVSTTFSRYSLAPMRIQPGPRPVTTLPVAVER